MVRAHVIVELFACQGIVLQELEEMLVCPISKLKGTIVAVGGVFVAGFL